MDLPMLVARRALFEARLLNTHHSGIISPLTAFHAN
jgi:hypothetical protein